VFKSLVLLGNAAKYRVKGRHTCTVAIGFFIRHNKTSEGKCAMI
jgi:hypothetical protein